MHDGYRRWHKKIIADDLEKLGGPNQVRTCKYSDCAHVTEPDCAIQDAVEAGEIHAERYRSYVVLRTGEPTE